MTLIVGLVGVALGWLLKFTSDYFAERRANQRADILWRRDKYVDAVADFILCLS